MTFRVGMKVVCVDAGPTTFGRAVNLVLKQVYTVSGIDTRMTRNAPYGVFLAEVDEPETRWEYASYHPRRFRPAVAPKTDIAIFTRMLAPQSERV